MVFSSSLFLLMFLPVFLLCYELSPKKIKNYTLLVFSILFYWWGAPKFIFVLLAFTLINYFTVKFMEQSTEDKRRNFFCVLSVVLNIGLLIVFKYSNLFVHSLNGLLEMLGLRGFFWKDIALPIGISFFIFQSITYTIDIYRKETSGAENYFHYLLYIIAFPQLIAGPIVRYSSISKQITDRNPTIDDKLQGFYRFCIGLGKKAIIANAMAVQADTVFNIKSVGDMLTVSSSDAWLALIAYTFQIYFDFSGYSDMAIGLGRMMGFSFPENFNNPYISLSVSEFWKRWHISLGNFMMNYLYIPLGGNRTKTKARNYLNLWIVFLISGFWHGASWNFLIWGAYHGLFIIADKVFLKRIFKNIPKIIPICLTFFVVMFGWSVFAIDDISIWGAFSERLFAFDNIAFYNLQPAFMVMIFFAVFFAFFFEYTPLKKVQDFFFRQQPYTNAQNIALFITMIALFVVSVAHISASDFNPFIYFRF